MPLSAALSNSSGEPLIHFTGFTIRITGKGNLKCRFISLDNVRENVMLPLPIDARTNRQPTRLGNFTEQRAYLEGKTTEIDEVFRINRIVVWAKPIASSFPQ